MIKNIIFYVISAIMLPFANGVGFKKNLSLSHRLQIREITGKQSFRGMTIKDQNFSGMNFRGMDFRGYTFVNVDFSNADLTETQFDGSTFEDVNLTGVILYYPLDDRGQPIMEKAFRSNIQLLTSLLYEYSDLMNNYERSQDEYLNQARALNKFCGFSINNISGIDLSYFNLKGVNLQEIDLKNVCLEDVQLQGAILPGGVIVPNYLEKDRTLIFKAWCFGSKADQKACQKLVNASFNIVTGVDHELLSEGLQSKKDLRNAYLPTAQLQGVDLSYANLEHAQLAYASLRGTNLQGANLKYAWLEGINLENANLSNADLSGAHVSDNFPLPDPCRDEDLIGIYRSCTDAKAKRVLEQILIAKNIPLD